MFIRFLLAALFIFGCTSSSTTLNDWMKDDGRPKVLSTTPIIDDMVSKIGEDRIHHISLISGDIDPHSYELVKGDDEKLKRADLIFYHGLGLEHGASLRYAIDHHPRSISLGDEVQMKNPESIIERDGQVDPHIWMDISLWSDAIDSVVTALSKADPQNTSLYLARGAELKYEYQNADLALKEKLSTIPEHKRYLVTSHDAFGYFARRYLSDESRDWNLRCKAPEGLSPDGQISYSDIRQITDHLKNYQIHVVFTESNVSRDSLKKIVSVSQEMGHDVKMSPFVLYADALGQDQNRASTYLDMMNRNGEALFHEWN
jgi:manganese/zinc/iron transport system substrate-binding protein